LKKEIKECEDRIEVGNNRINELSDVMKTKNSKLKELKTKNENIQGTINEIKKYEGEIVRLTKSIESTKANLREYLNESLDQINVMIDNFEQQLQSFSNERQQINTKIVAKKKKRKLILKIKIMFCIRNMPK